MKMEPKSPTAHPVGFTMLHVTIECRHYGTQAHKAMLHCSMATSSKPCRADEP